MEGKKGYLKKHTLCIFSTPYVFCAAVVNVFFTLLYFCVTGKTVWNSNYGLSFLYIPSFQFNIGTNEVRERETIVLGTISIIPVLQKLLKKREQKKKRHLSTAWETGPKGSNISKLFLTKIIVFLQHHQPEQKIPPKIHIGTFLCKISTSFLCNRKSYLARNLFSNLLPFRNF